MLERSADLESLKILTHDEVDNAANGVRAVYGGRTILQYLDAADGTLGYCRYINADNFVRDVAPTVNQNQSSGRAQPSEINGSDPLVRLTTRGKLIRLT